MAETIMLELVNQAGVKNIEIDSAGIIGYHAGEKADKRMRMHANRRGYNITHISRPIRTSDFDEFDIIISMDDSVHDSLLDKAPDIEHEEKIRKMTDFSIAMSATHVPDPYYGGSDGFEYVLDLLEDSCHGLLKHIIEE